MAKEATVHEFTIPERVRHLELKMYWLNEQVTYNVEVLNEVKKNQKLLEKIFKIIKKETL